MPSEYQMGRDAFHEGKTRNANPFVKCSDGCHAAWNDGWDYAREVDARIDHDARARERNAYIKAVSDNPREEK